ncbi:MAG: FAD-dependent oxidoreductase [Xanthomonadaceae bacterium]|jgi:D-amino-acid dehydrogenase|nr:FAD-dependent oxidoreductase [Xanthomonadaceae bacterium]
MTNRSDVLVLGGGVVGLASAVQLLRAGRSVTVLERGRAGGATSRGNCGTITPSHATPLAMPGMVAKAIKYLLQPDAPFRVAPRFDPALFGWLLHFARRCNWRRFEEITRVKGPLLVRARQRLADLVREEALDCGFEELGTLYCWRDERAFAQSAWLPRALATVGVEIRTLDGAAARALEPAINDSIVAAYHNPGDAHLRPDRYVAELARRVRELGGNLVEDAAVTDFLGDGDRIGAVVAGDQRHAAQDIVFALGAWSPALAARIGLDLPIQPGKGYSITYERPGRAPRIPVVCKERSVCVTAWKDGYRLGSTMEFAGYDTSMNRVRLDALVRGAREYLHEPEGPRRIEEWYGWRPMTWDDLPIIGRARNWRNLVLATGHGMLGVTMSAVTADLVRDIVLGKKPDLDPAPFGPARFGA